MNAFLTLACFTLLPPNPKIETKLTQVGPVPSGDQFVRSPNQTRAVLLLHGFVPQLREAGVHRAAFRPWQVPGSLLVKTLEKDGDVFSFAYSQNVPVDRIAPSGAFAEAVA